jgi:Transport and Golgi organisation 2
MCTVTYLPSPDGYYLTSNRDEKNSRGLALSPAYHRLQEEEVIFPQDPDAGGTWIVLKENGDALCLLNGAFEPFEFDEMHTMSRGKVPIEIAAAFDMRSAFTSSSFEHNAPFTLIMVNDSRLWELRWDGVEKHAKLLDEHSAHIWSSATLYNQEQRQLREEWFASWQLSHPSISLYNIFDFHRSGGTTDSNAALVMNRNDNFSTVSITGVIVNSSSFLMEHLDLRSNEITTIGFENFCH